jgi:hypothetical protein
MVQLREISSDPPPAEARSGGGRSLHSLNTDELRAEVERLRAVAAAAAAQATQQPPAPLADVAEGDEGDEEGGRALGCALRRRPSFHVASRLPRRVLLAGAGAG